MAVQQLGRVANVLIWACRIYRFRSPSGRLGVLTGDIADSMTQNSSPIHYINSVKTGGADIPVGYTDAGSSDTITLVDDGIIDMADSAYFTEPTQKPLILFRPTKATPLDEGTEETIEGINGQFKVRVQTAIYDIGERDIMVNTDSLYPSLQGGSIARLLKVCSKNHIQLDLMWYGFYTSGEFCKGFRWCFVQLPHITSEGMDVNNREIAEVTFKANPSQVDEFTVSNEEDRMNFSQKFQPFIKYHNRV